ncbi:MAG: nucleosidase [Pseudomonadota bacterium]
MNKDILIVFAMKEESHDVFDDCNVLHTGVGKVNAAYALTRALVTQEPKMVVNMGTAGSRKHEGGSVINPGVFVQRDMDFTPLGFKKFQTPFSEDPVRLEYGERIESLPGGVCGTGDNFDVSEEAATFDVVDMEAYALALICKREDVPFLCLKYVSDGADGDADTDWNDALQRAAEKLRQILEDIDL